MNNDINIDDEMTLCIRQAKDADMPSILTIEQDSFVEPRRQSEFDSHQNSLGMVAEHDNQVVGFVVYEIRLGKIRVLDIAVADVFRRQSVGTHLIDALIAQLCPGKPRSIVFITAETNASAIAFVGKLGFRSTKVLRGHFNNQEDAIRFEWNLRGHRDIASRKEVDDAT